MTWQLPTIATRCLIETLSLPTKTWLGSTAGVPAGCCLQLVQWDAVYLTQARRGW
jgi:hypothetical protein